MQGNGTYDGVQSGFEAILRAELARPADSVDVFVIDEIGKIECLSRVFAEAVTRVLDSRVPVLATVAAKGGGHHRGQVPTGRRGDHRLRKQLR